MSKSELQVIARILLICTAFYVLLQTFLTFFSSLSLLPFSLKSTVNSPLMLLIPISGYIALAAVVIYFLIHNSNSISKYISSSQSSDESQISWLYVAFRLVFVSTGIFLFYWTIPQFVLIIYRYIVSKPNQFYSTSWENIIEYFIMAMISIYLAFGAPGFVRWQVKMTLKQCNKLAEEKKSPA
jgi:hypothetical protein